MHNNRNRFSKIFRRSVPQDPLAGPGFARAFTACTQVDWCLEISLIKGKLVEGTHFACSLQESLKSVKKIAQASCACFKKLCIFSGVAWACCTCTVRMIQFVTESANQVDTKRHKRIKVTRDIAFASAVSLGYTRSAPLHFTHPCCL